MEFKEILHSLRTKHHLSQKNLADDLGVAQASINYWEKGQRTPSIEAVKSIAEYFHVTVDDLLGGVIEESKTSIRKTTNFLDYLSFLGYEIGENEHCDYQMHIKKSDTYIDLTSEDIKLLEDSTKMNIDTAIKLLVAAKTNRTK